jgi:hypothetical protein
LISGVEATTRIELVYTVLQAPQLEFSRVPEIVESLFSLLKI